MLSTGSGDKLPLPLLGSLDKPQGFYHLLFNGCWTKRVASRGSSPQTPPSTAHLLWACWGCSEDRPTQQMGQWEGKAQRCPHSVTVLTVPAPPPNLHFQP